MAEDVGITSPAAGASPPLRILHVISGIDLEAGGTATALLGLAVEQAKLGLSVSIMTILCAPEEPTSAAQYRAAGITVRFEPLISRFASQRNLRRVLREMIANSDVVHIHALWEEIQHHAARAAAQLGVPYVITPHGMLDPWSLSQRRWRKWLYLKLRMQQNLNRAAAIHFTTETERDLVKPLGLKAPTILEPNGVDLSEFEVLPPLGTFRKKYPQLAGRQMVLFLSRINYKKGLDLLIPAFAQCDLDDAMLVIAGPDTDGYRPVIDKLIAKHGLNDRVIFTGMLYGPDRVTALTDADLFVLSSYQENFGIAVIESLAAGVPVVISDQVNIHHQITTARVGAVIPAQIEPLARELNRWLNDPALRADAASRARPFVWEHYDWKRIARRWEENYRALLATAVPGKSSLAGAAGHADNSTH